MLLWHHCWWPTGARRWSRFVFFTFIFSWKYTESLSGTTRIHVFHANWAENIRNHCVEWSRFSCFILIELETYRITVWSVQDPRFSFKLSWKHSESLCGVSNIHVFYPNSAVNIWNHCVEWSAFIFLIIPNWCMLVDTECVEASAQDHPLAHDVSYSDMLRICFSCFIIDNQPVYVGGYRVVPEELVSSTPCAILLFEWTQMGFESPEGSTSVRWTMQMCVYHLEYPTEHEVSCSVASRKYVEWCKCASTSSSTLQSM